jgi:ferredoxin
MAAFWKATFHSSCIRFGQHALPSPGLNRGGRAPDADWLEVGLLNKIECCGFVVRKLVEREISMTYIITEPCIGTKDTACIDSCPVDCIHPRKDEEEFDGETQLYIDPEECIDCGACVPECPVEAIFPEDEVPEEWQKYIDINYKWYENR